MLYTETKPKKAPICAHMREKHQAKVNELLYDEKNQRTENVKDPSVTGIILQLT